MSSKSQKAFLKFIVPIKQEIWKLLQSFRSGSNSLLAMAFDSSIKVAFSMSSTFLSLETSSSLILAKYDICDETSMWMLWIKVFYDSRSNAMER